ncbi:MAG: response regulator, partial [Pseudomonadota bacterium]
MKQIYILDDDAGFRETASLWLDSLGWTVTAFDDPRTFMQAIGPKTANGFALMLDVRMPFMSGLQVIRKLNERGIKLPVIFVTGHGDVQLAVEAMREGAITFLEKPLDAFALESALDLVEGALKSDAKGVALDPVAERVA